MITSVNKILKIYLRERYFTVRARLLLAKWFRCSEEEVEDPRAGMLGSGPRKRVRYEGGGGR